MKDFWRGIDDKLLNKAKDFWKQPIGKEIINCKNNGHKQFQICVRENYFNVYWHGCSVLKYRPNAYTRKYLIHHKYVDVDIQSTDPYVTLEESNNDLIFLLPDQTPWSFKENIVEPALKQGYIHAVGRVKGKTSTGEKEELAAYLDKKKPCWLDLEIAFSREKEPGEVKKRTTVAERIDLAEIVMEKGIPKLRFVEVKLVTDSRLRAKMDNDQKVFKQLIHYRDFIEKQKEVKLLESYKAVAQNMLDIGLIHNNINLVKNFCKKGEIDDTPYLLIIGNISNMKKGQHGNHWNRLCDWLRKESFPQPINIPASEEN